MEKVTFDEVADIIGDTIRSRWLHENDEYNKSNYILCIGDGFKDLAPSFTAEDLDVNEFRINLCSLCILAVALRKLYENDMVIEPTDFAEVIEEMKQIHAKKDSDYGSSFDRSLDEDGLLVAKIRIGDKVNRLLRLTQPDAVQQVQDESIKDTLIDLANYCVMTVVWVRNKVAEQEENEE